MPSLALGDRLGPYEILGSIGAGGMGHVYRARDTRLDRTVAIKVAADHFTDRFEREARAIAQLNHPHICQLHDVGPNYLVMEYVEGAPIAGPLPLDRAVALACEILDAIGAAHKRGITHRDLKPANILLTKQGIKLLDFGLAKSAVSGYSGDHGETRAGVTAAGQIVGTLQYMAPEQLQGKEADPRSDLFSFGCVLHEMLTGTRAFDGADPASVIAAVLTRDAPSVAAVAPPLDRIVRRSLAKDPDQRFQTAGDLKAALLWAMEQPSAPSLTARPRRRALIIAGLLTAAIVLLSAGAGVAWLATRAARPRGETVRFELQPPLGAMWSPSPIASVAQLAVSPDGKQLAFVAALRRGAPQIWVRPLNSTQATALAGTEGASFPFWSPDNRAIGFFAQGRLKTVDLAGGQPQSLADGTGRGSAWGPAGDIIFNTSANSPIHRLTPGGGEVIAETTLRTDEDAVAQYFPQFLPDGRRFLYYQRSRRPEHTGVYVKTLGVSDARRVLATMGQALYAEGHLLHVRDGTLFAVPFDERTLQTRGDGVRIAEGVGYFGATFGYAAFSVSEGGVLVHGPSVVMATTLQWRDRTGAVVGTPLPPGIYRSPRLSPDENSVAVALLGEGGQSPDVYIFDLLRGGRSRVTSNPANDWFPVWAPDGSRLFFASARNGPSSLFQKSPSASGDGEQFSATSVAGMYPTDVSSDGRTVIFHQQTVGPAGYDLSVARGETPDATIQFLPSRFNEIQGRFSPNGRWVAYASDESGRFEIYVRPYPTAPGQWPISASGGMQPEWRGDGKELYFISGDGRLMAADVSTDGPTFTAGVPRALFEVDVPDSAAPHPSDYDVSADGKRFLINTVLDQPAKPAVTVILNWTAELPKR
jgi:Tol biopolymer transport system component